MLIYTSSWFEPVPPKTVRIGVSRGTPRGIHTRTIWKLAPGTWFHSVDMAEYRTRYLAQLGKLGPMAIIREIEYAARGLMPDAAAAALCCYESPRKPEAWCHRGYISEWFEATLGLVAPEIGYEGFGKCHPKLPAEYRGE